VTEKQDGGKLTVAPLLPPPNYNSQHENFFSLSIVCTLCVSVPEHGTQSTAFVSSYNWQQVEILSLALSLMGPAWNLCQVP
jgi:hypothetical protein